jgi:hypothetical protein
MKTVLFSMVLLSMTGCLSGGGSGGGDSSRTAPPTDNVGTDPGIVDPGNGTPNNGNPGNGGGNSNPTVDPYPNKVMYSGEDFSTLNMLSQDVNTTDAGDNMHCTDTGGSSEFLAAQNYFAWSGNPAVAPKCDFAYQIVDDEFEYRTHIYFSNSSTQANSLAINFTSDDDPNFVMRFRINQDLGPTGISIGLFVIDNGTPYMADSTGAGSVSGITDTDVKFVRDANGISVHIWNGSSWVFGREFLFSSHPAIEAKMKKAVRPQWVFTKTPSSTNYIGTDEIVVNANVVFDY